MRGTEMFFLHLPCLWGQSLRFPARQQQMASAASSEGSKGKENLDMVFTACSSLRFIGKGRKMSLNHYWGCLSTNNAKLDDAIHIHIAQLNLNPMFRKDWPWLIICETPRTQCLRIKMLDSSNSNVKKWLFMNHQSKGQPLRLGPFCCCYEACLYLKISLSSG